MIWLIIGWHILGIVVGATVSFIFRKSRDERRRAGTIRLDTSDGTPYLFLELEMDGMSKIHTNKQVILDVNLQNYISHN